MKKQPDRQRLVEGIIFILIGTAVLLLLPVQVAVAPTVQTRVSPAFLPRVVAIGLIVCGVAMFGLSFLGRTREKAVAFGRVETIRVSAAVLLLVSYAVLFNRVGFVVTSAVFLATFSYVFGARSVLKIGTAAVSVPVAVWLVFEYVLHVPLPHGLLF